VKKTPTCFQIRANSGAKWKPRTRRSKQPRNNLARMIYDKENEGRKKNCSQALKRKGSGRESHAIGVGLRVGAARSALFFVRVPGETRVELGQSVGRLACR